MGNPKKENQEKDPEQNPKQNDNTSYSDDTLGENTEVTPLGKALQEDKESEENDSSA